ncbi:UDP-N-acetylmuramate dehydrogenase [Candidatus Daviesbacteria bacterium]|nr:UDP-N-acetylmuramate dehydrogenase [Candidatus Daviesbacteria bacterium]
MLNFKDSYSLSNITTLQIGGPAKKFVTVKTEKDLIEAIEYAVSQKIPYLIIGAGSNLLVSDEGVNSLVIKNEISGISTWEEPKPISQVSVKSGTKLQDLVDYAIIHNLAGLQKLTKIPGTVGGAVYGNAGAYGQTISDHLISVTVLNPHSLTTEQFSNKDCNFGYRNSIFKKNKYIILEAKFQLEKGDLEKMQMEEKEITWKRFVKYPPGIKCPGSFFKNIIAETLPKEILDKIPPEKIVYGKLTAGALLEEVGAKGQSVDGIKIADYHANLFINSGTGTAKAFYNLAKAYTQKVKEKFGITLEPEVQLINLPPLR